jgi:hypothetical protein
MNVKMISLVISLIFSSHSLQVSSQKLKEEGGGVASTHHSKSGTCYTCNNNLDAGNQ